MSTRTSLRHLGVAARTMLLATVVLGLGYTAVITGLGQLVLPGSANGSLLRSADGQVVGSALIGQSFTDADGAALPQYFQSRPSAAGTGYDGTASSGSNLGPENADLIASIGQRQAAVAVADDAATSDIPADAVTASGSGLDPHISPAYAQLQVARVAAARGLDPAVVSAIVAEHTTGRDLGFLGEPRVNVLELNIALDAAQR
ncbi:potassium-transporting ATPase subunit KdpC [Microbacterium sp. VKM Ac-2870]|uniref:potassium-transporting ATPase subunit KdpC n=1 Tax=Microbacterium sp. VKM Ac-2870 TaxID=2783825 RepID=UPI00188AE12C|nr:potassium-transporting ATPase subunit KdpC [Microbacterium sp. VKM Ac-2870]MBF4562700.1 potassium-transporting ATPase subunit KdpC [Microbacterium sp. VKM Ac-2870]